MPTSAEEQEITIAAQTREQDIIRAAQKRPIDYLVLSGGGLKGVGFYGVYEALEDSKVMSGLKAISGSSSGAIIASFFALGFGAKKFKVYSDDMDFKKSCGESVSKNLVGKYFFKSGNPLEDGLRLNHRNHVEDFFKNTEVETICQDRLQTIKSEKEQLNEQLAALGDKPYTEQNSDIKKSISLSLAELTTNRSKLEEIINKDYDEYRKLLTKVTEPAANAAGDVTFNDLDLLRLLNPEEFKSLVVNAAVLETGELKIFSAKDTPHVSIAEACRASAALPLVLVPKTIDEIIYVDGGIIDDIPVACFFDKPIEEHAADQSDVEAPKESEILENPQQQGRALIVVFGSGPQAIANIAINSGEYLQSYSWLMGKIKNMIVTYGIGVGGGFKCAETEDALYNMLRAQHSLDTIVLDTKGIETTSFAAAQKYEEYLGIKASIQTREHLDNHEIAIEASRDFPYRKFALEVYENYNKKNLADDYWSNVGSRITAFLAQKIRNIDTTKHDTKAELLLDFSNKNKWQEAPNGLSQVDVAVDISIQNVLKDLVLTAATFDYSNTNTPRNTSTKSMDALIQTLNSKTIAVAVKQQFIDLLILEIDRDPKLKAQEFQFKKTDFDNLLATNKNYKLPGVMVLKQKSGFSSNSDPLEPFDNPKDIKYHEYRQVAPEDFLINRKGLVHNQEFNDDVDYSGNSTDDSGSIG